MGLVAFQLVIGTFFLIYFGLATAAREASSHLVYEIIPECIGGYFSFLFCRICCFLRFSWKFFISVPKELLFFKCHRYRNPEDQPLVT